MKGMVANCKWESIGIYRVPHDDILAIEKSAASTLPT
jgi:hypothetical protein